MYGRKEPEFGCSALPFNRQSLCLARIISYELEVGLKPASWPALFAALQ